MWVTALLATSLSANAATKTLQLTEASSGQTVPAVVGSIIHIDLSDGMAWSEVDLPLLSSLDQSTAVLKKVSGSTTTDGGSHAVFRVMHGGQATLKATGRAKCESATPCPMFMLQWSVLLTVPDAL